MDILTASLTRRIVLATLNGSHALPLRLSDFVRYYSDLDGVSYYKVGAVGLLYSLGSYYRAAFYDALYIFECAYYNRYAEDIPAAKADAMRIGMVYA